MAPTKEKSGTFAMKAPRYRAIPFGMKSLLLQSWLSYRKTFNLRDSFTFQGKTYNYLEHRYHATWITERGIELPIFYDFVSQNADKNILEVGNVLSHYFPVNHDIVDKYENDANVINQDILDFHPNQKYDLIISISTIEHIGWDESPRDPDKVIRTVDHMKSLLAPNGKMVVSIPIGYNEHLDKLIDNNVIKFSKVHCFIRVARVNGWRETSWQEIRNAQYHQPFNNANALVIGVIMSSK